METQTKLLNTLQAGDRVVKVGDQDLERPFEVTEVRTATLGKKVVPTFVILEGGRFWPTGRKDARVVEVLKARP